MVLVVLVAAVVVVAAAAAVVVWNFVRHCPEATTVTSASSNLRSGCSSLTCGAFVPFLLLLLTHPLPPPPLQRRHTTGVRHCRPHVHGRLRR